MLSSVKTNKNDSISNGSTCIKRSIILLVSVIYRLHEGPLTLPFFFCRRLWFYSVRKHHGIAVETLQPRTYIHWSYKRVYATLTAIAVTGDVFGIFTPTLWGGRRNYVFRRYKGSNRCRVDQINRKLPRGPLERRRQNKRLSLIAQSGLGD